MIMQTDTACNTTSSFERGEGNNASSSPIPTGEIIATPGNYCKHISYDPRFFKAPNTHKPRAKAIQEIIQKLSKSYFNPKRQLRTLQIHLETTGHQVRSARREACISLLQAMIYYADDATGRVGRMLDNGFFDDVSLKKLAAYANLKYTRAKRAMRDIAKSGYIKLARQWVVDTVTGEKRALVSRREFLPKFFIELGKGHLWKKWVRNKDYIRKKFESKLSKYQKLNAKALTHLVKETVRATVSLFKRKENKEEPNHDFERNKLVTSEAMRLYLEDQGKQPLANYFNKAKERYGKS